jgi:PEP-CTERM motif
MKKLLALVVLTLGFAASAQADYIPASWTDTVTFTGSQGGVYLGSYASYPYTHNLTDNGFRPLYDVITSFALNINLKDDSGYDAVETAYIDIPGATGDSYVYNFGLSGAEYGGWSIAGVLQLNLLGTLSVTISSITGDFILQNSTLVARGYANVPEPGVLGLLGIGLLGMALSMRRRKSAPLA